jgi:hypothetical protein
MEQRWLLEPLQRDGEIWGVSAETVETGGGR